MSWHDGCSTWLSRIATSRDDEDFNDVVFEVDGEDVKANRTILSMASPVMKTAFLGPLAEKPDVPIAVEDGTPRGFKSMLAFVYNDGEYSIKDLLDGKEEVTECDDLHKLMELVYFGHKYQINNLICFCRNIIILKVKFTCENVMTLYSGIEEYDTTLDTEYGMVSAIINEFMDANFFNIYKNGLITKENYVSETLMLNLLKRQSLANVTEGFVMQVALNYVRFSSEEANWMDMARRFIPKAIDFSKLSLKELDLTGTYNILPKEVLVEIFTQTTEANKNGLVGSSLRKGGVQSPIKVDVLQNPLIRKTDQVTSCQVKLKVNQKCLFQFNVQDQRNRLYGNSSGTSRPYKSISWKPDGGIKEVAVNERINMMKFFAQPNIKITLQLEMAQPVNLYSLDQSKKGKFMGKDGKFELDILEVDGQPIQEVIAFDKGVPFCSLDFFLL